MAGVPSLLERSGKASPRKPLRPEANRPPQEEVRDSGAAWAGAARHLEPLGAQPASQRLS